MLTGRTTVVGAAAGLEKPLFVLPNGEGLGYGLFVLDAASRDYLLAHIEDVPDALTRGSAWVTLWDNLLEGQVPRPAFFDAALRALPRETDEQNADRVLGYLTRTFWRFLPADERAAVGAVARGDAASRDWSAPRPRARRRRGSTPIATRRCRATALAWLERVWRRDETDRRAAAGRARRDHAGAGARRARSARVGRASCARSSIARRIRTARRASRS